MNIENVAEIIHEELQYIYCHNCSSQKTEKRCDECHRKAMNWQLSIEAAKLIAEKIKDAEP